jgi:hypothetical protein
MAKIVLQRFPSIEYAILFDTEATYTPFIAAWVVHETNPDDIW